MFFVTGKTDKTPVAHATSLPSQARALRLESLLPPFSRFINGPRSCQTHTTIQAETTPASFVEFADANATTPSPHAVAVFSWVDNAFTMTL